MPPKPTRQSPPGPQPSGRPIVRPSPSPPIANGAPKSLRDRITTEAPTGGIKFLVYGQGKRGKTRFACTFPKPLLLLGTEDGRRSLRKNLFRKGQVEFVLITESREMEDAFDLAGEGYYKTVVIDTVGGLQDIILKEVLNLDDIPVQKTWGMTSKEGGKQAWGMVGLQFKERIRKFIDLAEHSPLHFVAIAHERAFNEDSELGAVIGPALTPTAASYLNAKCDYVCQMFTRPGMKVEVATVAGQPIETRSPTGKQEYCLRTDSSGGHYSGFRTDFDLPEVIIDPTYDKIVSLVEGTYES